MPLGYDQQQARIVFKPIDDGLIVGLCHMTPFDRWIQLDPDWWSDASYARRMMLLRHEQGHCDHDMEHDPREMEDGCPYSIMYPMIPSQECYDLHYIHYANEYAGRILNEDLVSWD